MNSAEMLGYSSILIVDDDPVYCRVLEFVLQKIGCNNFKVGNSFEEGIELFQQFNFDLCLLDIELGDNSPTGIKLAEQIRLINRRVPIIFVTSHFTLDYYFSCRHTEPSHFINKRISLTKFTQAIELALNENEKYRRCKKRFSASKLLVKHDEQKIYLNTGEYLEPFRLIDIAYFFNKNQKTFVRTGNRNIQLHVSLKAINERDLPSFIRIHKSYIVNLNYIDSILKKDSKVRIKCEALPIGNSFRESFFKRINPLK
jgi:DNA-binding LytR/AlgR family response regulator